MRLKDPMKRLNSFNASNCDHQYNFISISLNQIKTWVVHTQGNKSLLRSSTERRFKFKVFQENMKMRSSQNIRVHE